MHGPYHLLKLSNLNEYSYFEFQQFDGCHCCWSMGIILCTIVVTERSKASALLWNRRLLVHNFSF